jgi:signal transduction histidine kinase
MTTLPRRLLAAHAAVAGVGLASMIAAAVVLARIGAVAADPWLVTAIWSLLALSGASLLFLFFAVRRVASEMSEQLRGVAALAEANAPAPDADTRLAVAEFDQLGSAVMRVSAQREAAEADLASERRRLAAMVRTLPIGLLIVDPAGRVALCNEAAVNQVAQLDPEMHCTPGAMIAPSLISRLGDDGGLSRGGPREVAIGDGTLLEVGDHALDQSGDRLWVLRDVTAERSLAQRRMQFLLRTAHELRTPLASLAMAISMLRAHCEGEPVAPRDPSGIGRAAYDSVQRLTQLTERLLRWGALMQQPTIADPQDVPWPDLAQAVCARGKSWSQRYDKPVSFLSVSGGSAIATRLDHLLALLDELLDNAFRAARGSGGVEIGMQAQDGWLTLSVRDHGAGMSAAARASWQAPLAAAGPRPGDGAGLGLAIAAELARVIGADLRLAPLRVGTGTRFDIRVPLSGVDNFGSRADGNAPAAVSAHRTNAANQNRRHSIESLLHATPHRVKAR